MTCFGARRHDRSRLSPHYQPVLYRDFDWSVALERLAEVHFREAYSTGFIRSLARDGAYVGGCANPFGSSLVGLDGDEYGAGCGCPQCMHREAKGSLVDTRKIAGHD
jgi:hypothetical protein